MRTAPSFFLLGSGENPTTVKWTVKDRLLTLAVLELDKEKCPQCGTPIWLGHTAEPGIEFQLEWAVCYGCQEKAELLKGIDVKPGEYAKVKAVDEEGNASSLRREQGLSNLAKPVKEASSTPKPQHVPGSLGE